MFYPAIRMNGHLEHVDSTNMPSLFVLGLQPQICDVLCISRLEKYIHEKFKKIYLGDGTKLPKQNCRDHLLEFSKI